MPTCKMEPAECMTGEDEVPHAMAFTVTFDSAKTTNNKFIKRHIRNLSLPISKVYDNKVTSENSINGKPLKKPGNHSEGYFSSDPEEENSSSNLPSTAKNGKLRGCSVGEVAERMTGGRGAENVEEEEGGSDVASETGTYTIEKETPEVITARLSIDANFGVQHDTAKHSGARESMTWINEWATQVVNHNKTVSPSMATTEHHSKSTITKTLSTISGVSKIPSPLSTRARFGSKPTKSGSSKSDEGRCQGYAQRGMLSSASRPKDECSDSSLETECFLKTTEKVMSALAARMSLSLDSGGESDVDARSSMPKSVLHHSDSSASESPQPVNNNSTNASARYNRAFSSLRRGRLDEGGTKKVDRSPPGAVRGAVAGGGTTPRTKAVTPSPNVTVRPVKATTPQALSRTDTGRFSMRAKHLPQTPQLCGSNGSASVGKKKSSGGRSNSTLSSKEVEFQNWKRRKSYDPMKAAAEGKKKEAARKQIPNIMTQSTTNATTTPKSPVNSVLRSASFHGTRQLGGASSSEEDEEVTLSPEEDDFPLPQAPKTSLENSPRGSRVSLYNSTSSATPTRTRHKLEGVDNLVVSAIHGMSNKLKVTASSLLKKLRYLYDEESEKSKQLSNEIEQLELGEASSPHKSPSKELATTLRNLKRLDSTLKVLDETLFGEADYE